MSTMIKSEVLTRTNFQRMKVLTTEYRWKGKWITRYRIAKYLVTLFIIKLIPRVIHKTHGNIREY